MSHTFSPAATDVVIVGAGPAALLLARELVAQGITPTLVAPAAREGPIPVYGAFADEVEETVLAPFVSRRFARPWVAVDDDRAPTGRSEQVLPRAYVRIDGERLVAGLMAHLIDKAIRIEAAVTAAVAEGARMRVLLDDERTLSCRVVIDASGHKPVLVERIGEAPSAFQTAYGVVVESGPAGKDDDDMLFMDWSGNAAGPPTFLYALPCGDGRWFVEETALAARPAVSLSLLEERLMARLTTMGLRVVADSPVERCVIPLDPGLPVRDQNVVPFGAALSIVHPATGYLLVECARLAPLVAERIALALQRPDATSRSIACDVFDAVWSPSRRRAHGLLRYGSEMLMAFEPDGLARFFRTFFESDVDVWSSYLSSSTTDTALMRTMLHLFGHSDLTTKARMISGVLARDARDALMLVFAKQP